ncbi:YhgE/Pip domain-containing protein [Weissella viridescens]|nr:ABC transporter permease [Weissella viridescens]
MFKNKFYIFSLIVGLVLALILVVAQFPTARPVAKNIPIVMVNEDQGPMGQKVADKLTDITKIGTGSQATTLKWTHKPTEKAVKQAMNQEKYYGAIVIPKDFTQKMRGVSKTGEPVQVEVLINQAKNATLANNVQVMLTGMVTKMSAGMGLTMLQQLQQNQVPLQMVNTEALTNPIVPKVSVQHSVKEKNSASSAYFQPLWMASLFATFLVFTAGKAVKIKQQRQLWQLRLGQIGFLTVTAAIVGVATTGLVTHILNYTYDDFGKIAIFSMIAAGAFMFIMFGLEMWLGFAALPIIALLMLFSAPLMQLAPEMIPAVYHDWLLPWLPIRFLLDGAKSIVYYQANLFNTNTFKLVVVGAVGLGLIFLSISKDWWLTKRRSTK